MALATQIKPITCFECNAADIAKELSTDSERTSFLKLIALGRKEIAEGKFSDAESFFDEMDN